MIPIRCVITDDEPMARKGLQGYLSQIRFLELEGLCENVNRLEQVLEKTRVDLLFLDIEMPGVSGIDWLRKTDQRPLVIFTTAYEKYALEGFDLGVLDYLLKPISFDRFLRACNKAYDYFSQDKKLPGEEYFFVKAGQKLEKILVGQILFVEARQNYVSIATMEKKIIVHSTLKAIQGQLPDDRFMAVHKSFLVQLSRVDAVEGNLLHLGSETVPVSKTLKDAVLEKIIRQRPK